MLSEVIIYVITLTFDLAELWTIIIVYIFKWSIMLTMIINLYLLMMCVVNILMLLWLF